MTDTPQAAPASEKSEPTFNAFDKYTLAKLANQIPTILHFTDKSENELREQAQKLGIPNDTTAEFLELGTQNGRKDLLNKFGVNEQTPDNFRLVYYREPDNTITDTLFKATLEGDKLILTEMGHSPLASNFSGANKNSPGDTIQRIAPTTKFHTIPPITVSLSTNSISKQPVSDAPGTFIEQITLSAGEASTVHDKISLAAALSKGTDTPLEHQGAPKAAVQGTKAIGQ